MVVKLYATYIFSIVQISPSPNLGVPCVLVPANMPPFLLTGQFLPPPTIGFFGVAGFAARASGANLSKAPRGRGCSTISPTISSMCSLSKGHRWRTNLKKVADTRYQSPSPPPLGEIQTSTTEAHQGFKKVPMTQPFFSSVKFNLGEERLTRCRAQR